MDKEGLDNDWFSTILHIHVALQNNFEFEKSLTTKSVPGIHDKVVGAGNLMSSFLHTCLPQLAFRGRSAPLQVLSHNPSLTLNLGA